MHSSLKRKFADLDLAHGVTDWKIRLSVAVAFAFHKKIVWWHGNRCVTCHTERSVCYQDEAQDSSFWFSPNNIAPRFSHFRFRQENEFDFGMAFRCLLEVPKRSTSLSESGLTNSNCLARAPRDSAAVGGLPRLKLLTIDFIAICRLVGPFPWHAPMAL